jgi:hypothetical protein
LDDDFKLVAGIVPFPVNMANPTLGPTPSELDLAYLEAKSVRKKRMRLEY